MRTDPVSKCGFIELAGGDRKHGQRGICLRCGKTVAVERQKHTYRKESRALVAIDKWMIFCKPDPVRGSEIGKIGIAIGRKIEWWRLRASIRSSSGSRIA